MVGVLRHCRGKGCWWVSQDTVGGRLLVGVSRHCRRKVVGGCLKTPTNNEHSRVPSHPTRANVLGSQINKRTYSNYVSPMTEYVYSDSPRAGRLRGSNPDGGEIFRTRPGPFWGLPSLLYDGYRVFPGGKAAEAWR